MININKFRLVGGIFMLLVFLAIMICAIWVLQKFPNSADEYAYIFQAKNLARLQIYHHIHPLNIYAEHIQPYFNFVHIGETDGRYYGRFPPGYSLLLIPAVWWQQLTSLEWYWLTNAIIGLLSIGLIFKFGQRFFCTKVGIFSAIALAFNPWFLLNSASYFSHASNTFFMALSLYLLLQALELKITVPHRKNLLMFSGLSIGFAFLIRYLDPVAWGVGFIAIYIINYNKFSKINKEIIWFFVGLLLPAILFLIYNNELTGDPFKTAYEYYNPDDQGTRFILFGQRADGSRFLDWSALYHVGWLVNTRPNLALLAEWDPWVWLALPLPLVTLIHRKFRQRQLIFSLVLLPIIVVITYAIYGGPPMNQYGPRYYYSAIFPLSICAGVFLCWLYEYTKTTTLAVLFVFSIMALHSIWLITSQTRGWIHERRDIFYTVETSGISNAIVFLKTGSGAGMPPFDIPRNNLDFDNPVLIAQGRGGDYEPLMRTYPDRKYYEYTYSESEKKGSLNEVIRK